MKLERDYLFCRALQPFLRREAEAGIDVADKVDLSRLATKVTFTGKIALDGTTGEIEPPSALGGGRRTPEEVPLSEIIAELNTRFGGDFTKDHQVRAMIEHLAADDAMQAAAVANDAEGFRNVIEPRLQAEVLSQADSAETLVKQFLDNPEYREALLDVIGPLVQTKAKVARQQHCPIGELLGRTEDQWLELKPTFRVDAVTGEKFAPVETAAIKTVAGFLNSHDGGTLLLGVAEDGKGRGVPSGLELDYVSVRKPGKGDADMFGLMVNQVLMNAVGPAALSNVTTEVLTVDSLDICRVHVRPCGFPVEAKVTEIDKQGQHRKKTLFYARINGQTITFADEAERQKYLSQRWPKT